MVTGDVAHARALMVLEHLRTDSDTAAGIARAVKCTNRRARQLAEYLREQGSVARISSGSGYRYYVTATGRSENPPSPKPPAKKAARQGGLAMWHNAAPTTALDVLDSLTERPMTTAEIVADTGRNKGTVQKAVAALTRQRMIKPAGPPTWCEGCGRFAGRQHALTPFGLRVHAKYWEAPRISEVVE